jgi:hypothetical protein
MGDIRALNVVVDEIFQVLEEVRDMFSKWDSSYHMPFIKKVMYLQTLREQLYRPGYADDFVETVIIIAYNNIFTKAERLAYAGNMVPSIKTSL